MFPFIQDKGLNKRISNLFVPDKVIESVLCSVCPDSEYNGGVRTEEGAGRSTQTRTPPVFFSDSHHGLLPPGLRRAPKLLTRMCRGKKKVEYIRDKYCQSVSRRSQATTNKQIKKKKT